ncbi:MAG: SPASM domain-containing protein [Acetobacteraceae bacterium]|nr:SPASM domain-containing protein [Acetobacteraceae bacterium]MDW8397529.1 SPASM domain-containing protein [Acetobacteraceae bacterium]
MEAIYWVLCWACHRRCAHCYEDRFRPYVRAALDAVIAEAERTAPRVLANLPEAMLYRDPASPEAPARPGRIILSGGEVLLDGVRQRVTYPVIEALRSRYEARGGVRIVVQTTGDLLTPAIVRDLLARGAWTISVAGVDDYHVGLEGPERQAAFKARLRAMMAAEGMTEAGLSLQDRSWLDAPGPLFSFFGATPDAWIGRLWPRGRAWANGLSTATIADNFCNRWSGAMNFLKHGWAGSEVSVEPDGNVYPCCIKTAVPIGNLAEEPLTGILDDLASDPAFAALDRGDPERMGEADGWTPEMFRARSHAVTPAGRPYANLCIGCDAFHREVLGARIAAARARRLAARRMTEAAE